MVLGISSLVLLWVPFVGVILGILAIIFGAVGIRQTGTDPNLGGRGMAIAGLVCGIIGVAIWVILVAWIGLLAFWA